MQEKQQGTIDVKKINVDDNNNNNCKKINVDDDNNKNWKKINVVFKMA